MEPGIAPGHQGLLEGRLEVVHTYSVTVVGKTQGYIYDPGQARMTAFIGGFLALGAEILTLLRPVLLDSRTDYGRAGRAEVGGVGGFLGFQSVFLDKK